MSMPIPVSRVELADVSRIFEQLLRRHGKPYVFRDAVSGLDLPLEWDEVASPKGLLPAFLIAADSVWLRATGNGFALDVVEQPGSLLGYVVSKVAGGSFSSLMLSMMEVQHQLDTDGPSLFGNGLLEIWQQSPTPQQVKLAIPKPDPTASSPTPRP